MKRIIFTILSVMAITVVLLVNSTSTYSSPSGAPERSSGSPSDGQTCANSNCHTGTAVPQTGFITSNVPLTGYIPGNTYTFTVNIAQSGISKWGFTVSPQNSSGNVLGTLVVTNSTQTQIKSSGNYITHKTAGNSGAGSKSWTFNWIAPSVGTGDVPFYTVVMAANNNTTETGDITYTEIYTISEDLITSLEDIKTDYISTYPNPLNKDNLNVSFISRSNKDINIKVLTLTGSLVQESNYVSIHNGEQITNLNFENIPKGVYIIQVKTNGNILTKRIIRQ